MNQFVDKHLNADIAEDKLKMEHLKGSTSDNSKKSSQRK